MTATTELVGGPAVLERGAPLRTDPHDPANTAHMSGRLVGPRNGIGEAARAGVAALLDEDADALPAADGIAATVRC